MSNGGAICLSKNFVNKKLIERLMKKFYFKRLKNISLLLLLISSSVEYKVCSKNVISGISPLPMMPTKAEQKRIDILRGKQRLRLRNKLDKALMHVQALNKSIDQDAQYLTYFTQTWFATLLKKSKIMHKKALSLQAASLVTDKKNSSEKKLLDAISSDRWSKQSQLRVKIEQVMALALLARQAVTKREKQERMIQKKERLFQVKITDLEKEIAQKELQLECACSKAQEYANKLIKLSKTEELAYAVPPIDPLNEIS